MGDCILIEKINIKNKFFFLLELGEQSFFLLLFISWPLVLERHNGDRTMLWTSPSMCKLWATMPRKGRFLIRIPFMGARNSSCSNPVSSSSIVLYKIVNCSFNVLSGLCIPFYVFCSLQCKPWLTPSPEKIKYIIEP